jgi:hypothetical protein
MKKYKFLLKPIFFIFNLIFATWLVLWIEKIEPSDFGEHKRFFDPAPEPRIVTKEDKTYLRELAIEFKKGELDSAALDKKLEQFLEVPKKESAQTTVPEDQADKLVQR